MGLPLVFPDEIRYCFTSITKFGKTQEKQMSARSKKLLFPVIVLFCIASCGIFAETIEERINRLRLSGTNEKKANAIFNEALDFARDYYDYKTPDTTCSVRDGSELLTLDCTTRGTRKIVDCAKLRKVLQLLFRSKGIPESESASADLNSKIWIMKDYPCFDSKIKGNVRKPGTKTDKADSYTEGTIFATHYFLKGPTKCYDLCMSSIYPSHDFNFPTVGNGPLESLAARSAFAGTAYKTKGGEYVVLALRKDTTNKVKKIVSEAPYVAIKISDLVKFETTRAKRSSGDGKKIDEDIINWLKVHFGSRDSAINPKLVAFFSELGL